MKRRGFWDGFWDGLGNPYLAVCVGCGNLVLAAYGAWHGWYGSAIWNAVVAVLVFVSASYSRARAKAGGGHG